MDEDIRKLKQKMAALLRIKNKSPIERIEIILI